MPEIAISVIVPFYNRENFLADCLASIECQTLSNIEIICVNDGSSDGSAAIVEEFIHDDPRFKLFTLGTNQGVSAARNYGIKQATGNYIAFMDSDDWYPENTTLEKLYSAAIAHNAAITGGSLAEYRTRNKELVTKFKESENLQRDFVFKEAGLVDYRNWQGSYGFYRFIYKRDLISEHAIEFPDHVRQEDPIFLVKCMLAAKQFYAIPDTVYCLRVQHKNPIMSAATALDGLNAIFELIELSFKEDLPILREFQYNVLRWFVLEAPVEREFGSWKEIGAMVTKQAKDSVKLRLGKSTNH